MDDLTFNLPGVAVYLDDVLAEKMPRIITTISQWLLDRLHDKGLQWKREKSCFAQPQVDYLDHMLKRAGIHQGPKINAVLKLPAPTDITSKSFQNLVQFYANFLVPQVPAKLQSDP